MFFYMLNVYQVYFNRNVRTTEWYTLSAGKGKKKKKKTKFGFFICPFCFGKQKEEYFHNLKRLFLQKT